ncbi:MAG TPA: FkbM family methyltransferase [Sphingomicrobium sp.]|nr:FkbM family methyltransferase [Sphingomicrobium sp.]
MNNPLAVSLRPIVAALPADFRLVVADIGSVGGLHKRWESIADRLVTINFDPLDPRDSTESARSFPYLVGDEEKVATLKMTRRATMSSTLPPSRNFFAPFWDKPSHVEVVKEIQAPMVRLDQLMAREKLSPDAIKIDVQGGEAAVIAGATDTFRGSILLAEIECSFAVRYEGQESFDQIVARMRDLGFGLLDVRRLKRYRYQNAEGVRDPSLGQGMRAGRLAFCDAIFALEPELLWQRIERGGEANGPYAALKAMLLFLTYGKADLAATMLDRGAEDMPAATRDACLRFFARLKGDGGWKQRLHQKVDRLARIV